MVTGGGGVVEEDQQLLKWSGGWFIGQFVMTANQIKRKGDFD